MTEESRSVYSDSRSEFLLQWQRIHEFREKFTRQAVHSFMFLCAGMGLIAFLLPIALVTTGGYWTNPSISAFYYAGELPRNILTGGLCAIGVFLMLFRGLSDRENWLLTIGGVAAIVVALSPGLKECRPAVTLHLGAAIVFFFCLGIVAIFLSKERIKTIQFDRWKRRFKLSYEVAGWAMVAMPAVAAAFYFAADDRCQSHGLFWLETFGIWAFSFYWFVKTAEYRLLLGVRWPAGLANRRRRGAPAP
jgi:hypothetical protein